VRAIEWCSEFVGLWRSAWFMLAADGNVHADDQYLIRRFDPDYIYGLEIDVESADGIRRFVNPFEAQTDNQPFNRERPGLPLTLASDLEVAESDKPPILNPRYQGDPIKLIWAASITGIFRDGALTAMANAGYQIDETPIDLNSAGGIATLGAHAFGDLPLGPGRLPRTVQGRHLARAGNPRTPWYQTPVVLVVGNALEDMALFWTLRALRPNVFWMPLSALGWIQFANSVQTWIDTEVLQAADKIALISRSVATANLQPVVPAITPAHHGGLQQVAISIEGSEALPALLPDAPIEVVFGSTRIESSIFARGLSGHFVPRGSLGDMPSVKVAKLRLLQEVTVVDHRLVPRAVFNNRLDPPTPDPGCRATRDGWAFSAMRPLLWANDTWESAGTLGRLQLRDPIQEALGLLNGLEIAYELSAAGQFITQTAQFFSDLVDASDYITRPPVARLLDAFRRVELNQIPKGLPGVVLEQRRYMQLADMATVTGTDGEAATAFVTELVNIGILSRGFAIKCPLCRFAGYYPLEQVGQRFICRRCRREQIWSLADVRAPQPELFYGLDEIVFQMASQDGVAVLRAIKNLAVNKSSVILAPGVNYTIPGEARPWEADLLGIIDGRVILAEVKNAERAEQRQLEKYRQLALAVRADDVHVITTIGWTAGAEASIAQLRSQVAPSHIAVQSVALDLDRYVSK
jgi:hypothetical protein